MRSTSSPKMELQKQGFRTSYEWEVLLSSLISGSPAATQVYKGKKLVGSYEGCGPRLEYEVYDKGADGAGFAAVMEICKKKAA